MSLRRQRRRSTRLDGTTSLPPVSFTDDDDDEEDEAFVASLSSSSSSSSCSSYSSSVCSSPKKRRRSEGKHHSAPGVATSPPLVAAGGAGSEAKLDDATTTSGGGERSRTTARDDSKVRTNNSSNREEVVQENNNSNENDDNDDNDNDDNDDVDDDGEVEFLLTIKPSYAQQQLLQTHDSDDDDDDDDEVEFISSLSLNEIMTRARENSNNNAAATAAAAATATAIATPVAEPSSVVQSTTTKTVIAKPGGEQTTTHSTTTASSLPAIMDSIAAAINSSTTSSNHTAASTCTMRSSSMDDFRDDRDIRQTDDRKLPARVSEVGMTTIIQKQQRLSTTKTSSSSLSLQSSIARSSSSSSSSYPLITSAYLQNLAEICSIIGDDARWRVASEQDAKNSQEALFRWENGDDLSAVSALKHVHQQPVQRCRRRRNNTDCTCLLCRDNKKQVEPKNTQQQQEDQKNEAAAMATDDQEEEDPTLSAAATTTIDDKDIQWLYLYCRLFYRRGPWFRVDDIYERYYKPTIQLLDAPAAKETKSSPLDSNKEEQITADPASSASNTTRFNQNGNKRAASPPVVNETVLSMHMGRLDGLLHDLSRLQAAGLIRSFHDEEECGKTVGVSLLTQDLRTIVLSKLGGTAKKQQQGQQKNKWQQKSTATQQPKNLENEIWNQMQRQQSIFASSNTGRIEKSLLPVCKHVDDVILQKLVTDILKVSCAIPSNAHLPVSISRSWANQLKAKIRQTAKAVGLLSTTISMTCFRLREKPTLILQRCCRLFLCATNGPGQMRGDETNGWKSLKDQSDHNNSGTRPPPLVKRVKPPCLSTWYQVTYPGCAYRFGIMPAHFLDAYECIPVNDKKNSATIDMTNIVSTNIQVFASREDFRAWELCVELRANVDYLNELNGTIRGEERRHRGRQSEDSGTDQESAIASISAGGSVDFMALLTESGRNDVLRTLLPSWNISHECRKLLLKTLQEKIQNDIEELDGSLKDEWEQILVTIGVLAIHVLGARNHYISDHECSRMELRPWLRHMWWDGNLAYILWDIVPLLERRELYVLAVQGLEILLFGSCEKAPRTALTSRLAPLLLSRRARGKVCGRLVIDYTHMNRLKNRTLEAASSRKEASDKAALEVMQFCERTIASAVHSAFISFSSLRGLARRLKQPLATTLAGVFCTEANELGLRLENDTSTVAAVEEEEGEDKKKTCYSDWGPITDRYIANAVAGDDKGAGSRCVFVGHDDGSFNVEELAMECYQSGRLPVVAAEEGDTADASEPHTGGGWVGWHDEGGHIRALFRILCAGPILGMDSGCYDASSAIAGGKTIHLSPYQGAPFDLHVGFELRNPSPAISDHPQGHIAATPGFYFRRQVRIDAFLDKLTNLSPQEICDLVHDSVRTRLGFIAENARKDPSLERDLEKLRTLSMIAAGCGGKQLAAMFRCFFFDYRHYSGGLPDLLLVRARLRSESAPPPPASPPPLVDLSGWIGESFSHEHQAEMQAQRGAAMLADDEFLACGKVGDSGSGGGRRNRSRASGGTIRQTGDSTAGQKKTLSLDDMPSRLELVYNGHVVIPECLMVEVKSSNDRLDARQEDWLNILDRSGKNCRVCKFEASTKKPRQGGKNAAPKTAPAKHSS